MRDPAAPDNTKTSTAPAVAAVGGKDCRARGSPCSSGGCWNGVCDRQDMRRIAVSGANGMTPVQCRDSACIERLGKPVGQQLPLSSGHP